MHKNQYNDIMFDNDMIRIRNTPLLDLAVYLILTIFLGTAQVALPGLNDRIAVAILLILFGLAHTFGYRRASSPKQVNLYMAVQALLTTVMFLRFPAADVFDFLLYLLVIQVTIALPPRIAARWVVLILAIEAIHYFDNVTLDRIINLILFLPVYFLTGVFGYSLRRAEIAHREKELVLEELQKTQLQLQELAVTEERTRLSRELHDSLGHQLTVAVVQLEGAQRLIPTKPERASEMIATMRDELKNALADLRRTVTALRSPIADDLPLDSALLALCHTFEQNTGLVTHFSAAENLPELSESYRLALYRATQEGLTNIQRHAHAHNVWVILEADDKHITLTVRDDGKGADSQTEKRSGVGLIGLSERANLLGGETRFTSKPEAGGSTLTFILPLSEKRTSQ
jgi:signal transduction histidine kinase